MNSATQDRITLITNDFSGPAIPEKFLSDLKALDPTLLVRWNDRRRRFVIEQCTRHNAGPEHTHLCERIYVLLVQDPEGGMMGLHSGVLDTIRARDVTKAGYGPDSLKKFTQNAQDVDDANRKTIERKQREAVKACSADNRRQLLKAFNQLSNMGSPNR